MAKRKRRRKLSAVPFSKVHIDDAFWAPRLETNRTVTLPIEYAQCKQTGRVDAWKLQWKPGRRNQPHIFWDSDVAKWIEAVGYSLATHPDKKLEKLTDGVIDLIAGAQHADGYLNLHFTVVRPKDRWANLASDHELYCAGHLMEAAVAYYQGTGKRKLLDVLCRYTDYIEETFGPRRGQKRGYPGHEEIELALVKLYGATGERRYMDLATFFVDERGAQPHYFTKEAKARGDDPARYRHQDYQYNQSHLPLRQQREVVGHAVRAGYLYAGAADVAAETGDTALRTALRRLWANLTETRMYVTGGVGPTRRNEGFTFDYDLPNETAYAETCAAIALVFWARRMADLDPDSRYADVMERALYNGVLSGVSWDGRQFFYVNPLAAHPQPAPRGLPDGKTQHHRRQDWFGCACCPPNVARLLASFGGYVYSQGPREARVHLYVGGRAELTVGGRPVVLHQKTAYPWREKVRINVAPAAAATFTLALRMPGWCRGATIKVNGKTVRPPVEEGYAKIERRWAKGDRVDLTLPMPVERIEAHPKVRQDAGRVALQRGPVVYCLEQVDNGDGLANLSLPANGKLRTLFDRELFGGVTVITGKARRRESTGWSGQLYRPAASKSKTVPIKAIPYCLWANRALGEMIVWIRQA